MSNYSAAVEFFSSLCETQLNQQPSRLDAANDGLGATLVLRPQPRSLCAAVFMPLFINVLFPGRHVRCVRGGQRLLLCDVEARGRGLEVARVASVRVVQRAGVFGELRGAGNCSWRQSISLHSSSRCLSFRG